MSEKIKLQEEQMHVDEHAEACGCGHDHDHEAHEHHAHSHDESCGCGHDHEHDMHHNHDDHEHHAHSQDESCGCGHDHDHEHDHDDHRGHDHGHQHEHHERQMRSGKAKGTQRIFHLENLGCAHCASQMEQKISAMPEVNDCVLVYETKQLRVTANNPDALLPKIREICMAIEHDVKVLEEEHAHEHGGDHSKQDIIQIGTGAILLAASFIPVFVGTPQVILLIVAYIVLGWRVLYNAVRGIASGQAFDENFLMSIATIGAAIVGDYAEAVGVMLFYRVGEFCEDLAVEKSRRQIIEAVDQRPEVVTLVQDGETRTIPAADAKVDDIVLVRPGDRIPLDGIIVRGESRLDTSAVTGEPVPVHVGEGDKAISGCLNTEGVLHLRATHTLGDSMVTRILDSVENAAAQKPKLDRFITRFSRVYTPIVVLIAFLTAVIPGFITGQWYDWVYTALTFLVISCPCALVLSVPLTFFAGIGAGSKRGILFKGGISLEALKSIKAVVLDKTGTITKGNFAVQEICPIEGVDDDKLLALAAACESASTHPIAVSILAAREQQNALVLEAGNIHEQAGEGISATIEGASVLCGNAKLMRRHNVDLTGFTNTAGSTEVLLALDVKYIGHIRIADTIKSDAGAAISKLREQGMKTVMLTGDGVESANAVAKEVGIDGVYAQLLPDEKLSTLQTIRETDGAVMFVGDGINDAPVLAGADVGAAMGSGADAAIEAADVVFMNSELNAVPTAIGIARKTNRIAKQNIVFALAMKLLVLALGLFGIASMWLAVFADTGVALLCVLNSVRILRKNIKF